MNPVYLSPGHSAPPEPTEADEDWLDQLSAIEEAIAALRRAEKHWHECRDDEGAPAKMQTEIDEAISYFVDVKGERKVKADLLAALQLIAGSDDFNGGTFVKELQGIARAAIARATGGKP